MDIKEQQILNVEDLLQIQKELAGLFCSLDQEHELQGKVWKAMRSIDNLIDTINDERNKIN